MLVVAQMALINNIKIAHLCGGDITLVHMMIILEML